MAPESNQTQIEGVSVEQGEFYQGAQVGKSSEDLFGKLSHEIFKFDCLDRGLKRHHVTGCCPLDSLKDSSLTSNRNCFLGCRWNWSFSNFWADYSFGRSGRCSGGISFRRSYDFCRHAIACRDGQCKTGFRGDHGLPRRIRRRGPWVRSGCNVLVSTSLSTSFIVLAKQRAQASQLREHGDPDHSSGNVYTVLGSRIWHCSGYLCFAPSHHFDECMWRAGEHSFESGKSNMLSDGRSMEI